MTLSDLKRDGVLAAVEEYDRLGRDAFLLETGFRRARAYYLDYGGRLYDSKAIAGYGHGVSTGQPLLSGDFSGGDSTVARHLERLGFSVLNVPNPDWTRDEIVLACELVQDNGWRQVDASDPRAQQLSDLLQSTAIHPLPRNPDFRNLAGVAMKTYNIASAQPGYRGPRSNGNHLDREVLEDFLADPAGMRAAAAQIRELLIANPAGSLISDLPDPDLGTGEGGVTLRAHLRRERDPRLRRRKINDARRRSIPIACEACGFDFAQAYGSRGTDYIECHHRTPLHFTGQTQTRLADLALLCSNCHRMIHRTREWLTVEDLTDIVNVQRQIPAPALSSG